MKFNVTALSMAALIVLVVFLELFVGIKWSMHSHLHPDADLKPIRPVARFIFTGVVVTFTLIFGGALIRSIGWRE